MSGRRRTLQKRRNDVGIDLESGEVIYSHVDGPNNTRGMMVKCIVESVEESDGMTAPHALIGQAMIE